ncbi:MAG: hypothetical protein V1913_16475 [Fibrobacterota bacterium]
MIRLELSVAERGIIRHWFEFVQADSQHYGDGITLFPEEQVIIQKLALHPEGPVDFTEEQVDLIKDWMDAAIRSRYGKSIFVTPEERAVFEKISHCRS